MTSPARLQKIRCQVEGRSISALGLRECRWPVKARPKERSIYSAAFAANARSPIVPPTAGWPTGPLLRLLSQQSLNNRGASDRRYDGRQNVEGQNPDYGLLFAWRELPRPLWPLWARVVSVQVSKHPLFQSWPSIIAAAMSKPLRQQ